MDTFMDKLAQRLNAQEMINANSAADAEEMNRLRNQVTEYNECLLRMQEVNRETMEVNRQTVQLLENTIAPELKRLVDSGVRRLEQAGADDSAKNRLLEESISKLKELQQNTNLLEELKGQQGEKMEELVGMLEERLTKLEQQQEERLKELEQQQSKQLEKIENQQKEQLEELTRLLKEKGDNTETVNENTHKECVKVYRNVQAVVADECNKTAERGAEGIKGLRGKLNAILGVSAAALIAAVTGIIIQIVLFL